MSNDAAFAQLYACIERGELGVAEDLARHFLQSGAEKGRWWSWLGFILLLQGRYQESEFAYQQAVALNPQDAADWDNLGIAVRGQGRAAEAETYARNSVSLDPSNSNHWANLGASLMDQQKWEEATSTYRSALALHPTNSQIRYSLAEALLRLFRLAEAESLLRELLVEERNNPVLWSLLGEAQQAQGRSQEAVASLRRSLELNPTPHAHKRYLVALQYAEDVTPELLLRVHREWEANQVAPLLSKGPLGLGSRAEKGSLRIGLVSSDFCQHPLAFLALPAFEAAAFRQCSLFCYADGLAEDEYTARFQAISHQWRSIADFSDEQLAAQIHDDQVDILIDGMGHVGRRMLVFARRPARVQITWLGYVGTTGLSTMDFLLADRFHVRLGEEDNYVESILRMPNDYVCYGPPQNSPACSPLPALQSGRVVFGCFNDPYKYSPRMMDAWSEILKRVPDSTLLLKYRSLEQTGTQAGLISQLESRGVPRDRILFEGWSPHYELLAAYNRIDLALDTQPYSGGLTTCEALWMGVPVITFPGKTFAGRHSTSHLHNAGLPDFVASDLPGYIDLAVSWANRLDELASLRATLRHRLRTSPLMDAPTFAHHFLSLLHHALHSKS
jgi:predicted O-linked N-acetylglucosamine transferase (SPINDLY family)